jgi:predicted RNase H-like nuclease (RuvC/YqgF family)
VKFHGDREKIQSLKHKVRALEEDLSEQTRVTINLRGEVSELVGVISNQRLEFDAKEARMTEYIEMLEGKLSEVQRYIGLQNGVLGKL